KHGFLFERLREWDAHLNHLLLGRHWAERDADRMFSFFALEKAEVNPHWHGLIRFFTDDPIESTRQERLFDGNASRVWMRLVPSGTADVQTVHSQTGVSKY